MGLAATLIGVVLIIAALVVWQHAAHPSASLTYGIEDAVAFVQARITPEVEVRLGEAGIRRILEWEVFYLQGLAQDDRFQTVETVAGPYEPAVYYLAEHIERAHGRSYSLPDIEAVLELQAAYLASIGAVGDEVGGI